MKKSLFTTLVVAMSFVIAAALFYTLLTIYNLAGSFVAYNLMEYEKEQVINDSDSFINGETRVQDVTLSKKQYSEYKYIYIRDDIHFLSNVDEWDEEMLSALADELYANKHGEEIKYVSTIILNSGLEGEYIGTQEGIKETFNVPIDLYNFLPESDFLMRTVLSEINLYEADTRVTVEDMAIVLSHEYGHHFTDYHFNLTFTDEDSDTKYYNIRAAGNDKVLLETTDMDEYLENHMWYLCELAAEDYVYFLGSENAHRVVEFYDTVDKVSTYARGGDKKLKEIDYSYMACRNGQPHENVTMGLPSDIEGLEEYFYSFIDEDAPEQTSSEPIGTLNLKMKKTNSKEHTFTWNQPYSGKDVIYTLIAYDENDELMLMVRTRNGSQDGKAQLGDYKYNITKGNYIYTYSYSTGIDAGTKMRFRVSVTFPDDSMLLSDPIDIVY